MVKIDIDAFTFRQNELADFKRQDIKWLACLGGLRYLKWKSYKKDQLYSRELLRLITPHCIYNF